MSDENRDDLLSVFDASVDPMMIADSAGHILRTNPAFESLFGLARESVSTLTVGDLIPEHLRERHAAHLAEFRRAPHARRMNADLDNLLYGRRRDGTLIPTEINLSPLGGDRVLVVVRDISLRVRAEEGMRQCSERYASLLGMIPEIVVELDARHVLRWGNTAARCFFGDDLAGTSISRFQAVPHPGGFAQPADGSEHECWFLRTDGERRLLTWRCHRLSESNGTADGLICSARDVTERHRDQQAMSTLRTQMRQIHALHVAGQTVRRISHDLNQPLNALSAYATAALRLLDGATPQPDRLRATLEGCCDEAERAGDVVRGLLNFLDRDTLPLAPIDLAQAVRNAVDLCRDEGIDHAHIQVDIDPDLWPVAGNQQQVENVLHSLLSNSFDALRLAAVNDPSVRIEVRNEARRGAIQVTLSDNGPGIDATVAEHAFTPFFTTRRTGIGLGLTISRALIEANGGELWYDGEATPGATFRFTLPAGT